MNYKVRLDIDIAIVRHLRDSVFIIIIGGTKLGKLTNGTRHENGAYCHYLYYLKRGKRKWEC